MITMKLAKAHSRDRCLCMDAKEGRASVSTS